MEPARQGQFAGSFCAGHRAAAAMNMFRSINMPSRYASFIRSASSMPRDAVSNRIAILVAIRQIAARCDSFERHRLFPA
ncbi:hypothetical protein [Burkholderia ubonensis]|uniref:hypothetical protein n=1 Tax=Burkholderia ubonensis TaxID=101571 RepID=UPI00075E2F7A|nr:hypothetical protein [Burkholderia ubonensis]KUZ22988.1 hypothetical protein WI29_12325 [Burkholderia ubonensis]KUZ24736.1 hypothetical protein WI32_33495 [Burkholderia ubonensis]KUZ36668.1 hypothetical protein WI30_08075 [Burkholderia ubonensis]KUZ51450.1 hypothetical protein WI33_12830 [Burkholderia ubonensis]KUZ56960.1 hypothetical protein WI34_18065 [Burkholderia ubonensis]